MNNHQQEIVIKKSPVVFLKWLIVIEFSWAILIVIVALITDFNTLYNDLQLVRVASFEIMLAIIVTAFQVLFVTIAFISWYFDTYRIDRHKIVRQRGNFTGTSDIIDARGLDDAAGIAGDLNAYFTAMHGVVQEYGGVIDKVDLYDQGDKLMVLFGAPVAHEQDVQRAALTALAMQEAMRKLNTPTAALLSQRIGSPDPSPRAKRPGDLRCRGSNRPRRGS